MSLTYRIWDKTSPINACPADKAIESLGIKTTDQVYIIVNEDGADWIVQTQDNAPIKGATIEESAQNHINHILGEQVAEHEEAKKPTTEERIAALESAQLAALGV